MDKKTFRRKWLVEQLGKRYDFVPFIVALLACAFVAKLLWFLIRVFNSVFK